MEEPMLRRLSETFTATHLVLIIAIAVLAPSAVYATVSYSNVAITDATAGNTAAVDGGRKLSTYDPVAGYTRNPQFTVNISDLSSSSTGVHTIYTVPAGKALLIRSATWSYFNNTEGSNNFS